MGKGETVTQRQNKERQIMWRKIGEERQERRDEKWRTREGVVI